MTGYNLADPKIRKKGFHLESKKIEGSVPCIFISHISIDKRIALKIGEYIKYKDMNIYLDVFDEELQNATKNNNYNKISECIQKGILESSAVLCLVSNDTKKSWWVPFEIGFGKHAAKKIGTVALKKTFLPDYLKIEAVIDNTEDLDDFLNDLNEKNNRKEAIFERDLEEIVASILNESIEHPLKDLF